MGGREHSRSPRFEEAMLHFWVLKAEVLSSKIQEGLTQRTLVEEKNAH